MAESKIYCVTPEAVDGVAVGESVSDCIRFEESEKFNVVRIVSKSSSSDVKFADIPLGTK
jgi:hypothetical protein